MRDYLIDLQLFAEEEGEEEQAEENQTDEGDQDGGENAGEQEKTFTQSEIDAILTKRLARERKQWEKQVEEEKQKAAMTEQERLEVEKKEAETKAQAATDRANKVLINAEAKSIAAQLGINPERLNYAVKLADLDSVEFDDNGDPDLKAIDGAMKKVLEDLPELKKTSSNVGTGSNPGTQRNKNTDMNAFIRKMAGR